MKKNYRNYILYGLLILVIVVLVFAFTGFSSNIPIRTGNTKGQVADKSGFKSIDSGSTGMGDVSVELTPLGINNNQLSIKISVNTHSVSLGQFDLKEITTLEYNGKSIKPISAPNLGGHHSNGELVFEVGEQVNSFTIRIKGIPKVDERVFEWS
jgi:hypothetical protein